MVYPDPDFGVVSNEHHTNPEPKQVFVASSQGNGWGQHQQPQTAWVQQPMNDEIEISYDKGTTAPSIVDGNVYGQWPQNIVCPHCQAQVTPTSVNKKVNVDISGSILSW